MLKIAFQNFMGEHATVCNVLFFSKEFNTFFISSRDNSCSRDSYASFVNFESSKFLVKSFKHLSCCDNGIPASGKCRRKHCTEK